MDHIRHALSADGPDGEGRVLQPETVGRDLFQVEAFGGDLFERKFTGLIAVASGTLEW